MTARSRSPGVGRGAASRDPSPPASRPRAATMSLRVGRVREPVLGRVRIVVAGPVTVLGTFGGRVDHARDVTRAAKNETDLSAEKPGRGVDRGPRRDVVLLRRQHEQGVLILEDRWAFRRARDGRACEGRSRCRFSRGTRAASLPAAASNTEFQKRRSKAGGFFPSGSSSRGTTRSGRSPGSSRTCPEGDGSRGSRWPSCARAARSADPGR